MNPDPVNAADDAVIRALFSTDADFRNGYSLHLGGNYQATDKLTLRGGALFYWTPIPKDHFRPAVPDANSIAFSLGTSYQVTKNLNFDMAYFHRFWLRRHIDNDTSEILGTSVDGTYHSYLQEVMLGLTYKWGFEKDIYPSIETLRDLNHV